ncbi:phosphomannomutase/phosphoglucomutase [Aliikangiella sp. G2MR2-5]|uniref:phosphomannomutase/phosphoglucomutase n=1 Tax=Aliikangiella sp. G2MR2-5 TaxID=2788943 RepID=UPI00273A2837|nr:phosphomannomutase/phosphoglucomutase [Aliikangiella sp. G2MR2-5]
MKINKDKEKQKKKQSVKVKAKTLLSHSLPYLILCVLTIIFVAVVQYYLVVIAPAKERNETFVKVTMSSYMELVLSRLDSISFAAQSYLNDHDLKSKLRLGNPDDLLNIEKDLTERLIDVTGVRVLNQEILDVQPQSVPVITNVTLELIRTLKNSEKVIHEAINAGQASQHVAVLFGVKGTGKVILIGVDYKVFSKALPQERLVPGYYEFQQNFANQNRTIVSLGDNAFKQGEPLGVAKLNKTQWRIAFWPANPANFNSEMELILFFGGLFLVMTLVGVGGFIGLKRLQDMVRSDASAFVRWLLDSSKGQQISNLEYQLQVFEDMAKTIGREGVSLGASTRATQPKKAKEEKKAISHEPSSIIEALGSSSEGLEVETVQQGASGIIIPDSIFREYDIRGVVGDSLNAEIVKEIGRAIGSEAFERGEQRVAVARDGRLSGPELLNALKQGLMESGRDVIDVGEVPTPLLYFATNYLDASSGVVLTGSHNPKDYNGLKIVIGGKTLSGAEIQDLKKRIETDNMVKGQGSHETASITQDYVSQITSDVALVQPLKVAIDCGNGVAGMIAPQLLQALGCEVIGLYCKVDGNFPNHHPDPSKPENLQELIELVKSEGADVGLAFDGDGDRLGVVDSEGNIIWPDRQMMLYAMDVLSRNPGADIIFDVKCTKHLAKVISANGGHPIMWKTGHSLVKAKMRETGALLAGECSGHIFFKERWYGFDDALYTAARLLEILSADTRKSADIFKALPNSEVTPEINVAIADDKKFEFIERLSKQGAFGDGKMIDIDGVRVEYRDGWGLVRASNTTPSLVIRFEGDSPDIIERIKRIFKQQMLMIDSSLRLDF